MAGIMTEMAMIQGGTLDVPIAKAEKSRGVVYFCVFLLDRSSKIRPYDRLSTNAYMLDPLISE